MKLKDVGFLQQHLEKVILAVAGVFMLVILLMYLALNPFTVTLENQRLEPSEVPALVRDRAAELERRLQDEDPIGRAGELPTVPQLVDPFIESLRPRTLRFVMAPIGLGPMSPRDFEPPVDPNEPYYVPRPALPTEVVARAGNAVLAERPPDISRAIYRQFVELIGDREPRDFRYVSVAGDFNLDQWRERLEQKPEGAQGLQLRRLWWARMVGVAGVYLQRQQRDPLTGQWSEPVIVDTLPHQVAFRPTDRVDWDGEQAQTAIRFIRDNQPLIQRPDFVPITHTFWRPPHQMPAPLEADQLGELRTLNSRIERSRTQIERFERQLNIAPGARQPTNLTQREQAVWQRLERERENLEGYLRERDRLLGFDVEEQFEPAADPRRQQQRAPRRAAPGAGQPWEEPWDAEEMWDEPVDDPRADRRRAPAAGGTIPPWQRPDDAGRALAERDDEEPREQIVRVWTHDLSVEPGTTYRYRLIVSVLNPLFHQDRVPDEQREAYFDKVALGPDEQTLADSPWSDPVHVSPEHYFFLVGGSAETETAEIELWRIYDGQWRRGEFRLRPGDPIGGTAEIEIAEGRRIELPMQAEAVLVDLISRAAAAQFAGTDALRMLYLDMRTNMMADRSVDEDEQSLERMRLESEITLQQALGQQARANGRR